MVDFYIICNKYYSMFFYTDYNVHKVWLVLVWIFLDQNFIVFDLVEPISKQMIVDVTVQNNKYLYSQIIVVDTVTVEYMVTTT